MYSQLWGKGERQNKKECEERDGANQTLFVLLPRLLMLGTAALLLTRR